MNRVLSSKALFHKVLSLLFHFKANDIRSRPYTQNELNLLSFIMF